jgi:cell division inhibitor SepF
VSVWHRVKVLLGMADDDEYEEDEYYDADAEGEDVGRKPYTSPYASDKPAVRRVDRKPDLQRARDVAHSRDSGYPERSSSRAETPGAHLREVPRERQPQVKMHIAEPKSFTEAQSIADRFKDGTPVIMNLTTTDPDLSKRFLDFASGLTYGLNGGLQKVAERVFMLSPADVDVSAEDRRRLRDRGLFTIDN